MSTGFTKLFSSITDSTIWCESTSVRIVWITMLAMADRDGNIAASIPGLATRARVTVPECEEALTKFLSPDKYSRTPDHEGRRIEVIHGGWRLLNYNYYRNLQDRETVLERKRRWWNENKGANKTPLDAARQTRPDLTQAEAEAEADKATTLSGKPDVSARSLETKALKAEAETILSFLNDRAKRAYQSVPANIDPIIARLREGVTSTQLRQVVVKKCREWLHDDKMANYLRPTTLFNRTKCAQYVGELVPLEAENG